MSKLWTLPLLLLLLHIGEWARSEVYELQRDGPLDTNTYLLLHLQPLLLHPPTNHSLLPQHQDTSTEGNASCSPQEKYADSNGTMTDSPYWGNGTMDVNSSPLTQGENGTIGWTTYSPQGEKYTMDSKLPRSPWMTADTSDNTASAVALHPTAAGTFSSVPEMLENYTLCAFFSVFFFTQYATVLSYQAQDTEDTIRISVTEKMMYIRMNVTVRQIPLRLYPDTWCHLCLLATPTRTTIYNNGQELDTWSHDPEKLPLGGVLVVGQDQDTLGGGFSLGQAFRGRVSLLLLWQRHLTLREMDSLAACEDPPPAGSLFPWASPPWQLRGRVRPTNTSHCRHKLWTLFPFQKPLTFNEAVAYLHKLGMVMSIPSSDAQLQYTVELLANFSARCSSSFEEGKYMMLNGYYDSYTNTMRDPASNKTLQWTLASSNTNTYHSSGLVYLKESGAWGVSEHPLYTACYMGQYQQERPVFNLWGLCHNEYMKKFVKFVLSLNKNEIYFAGLFGLSIKKAGSTWSVLHLHKNVTLATVESVSLPIGRRSWNLTGADEDCTISSGPHLLTLSPCNRTNQFTCKDGTCIDMTARCDLASDCDDWSDEQNCELVKTPDGYLVHLPPQPPVNMALDVSFNDIDVNLLKMTVRLEINIQLVWYDTRIIFLNLRDDATSNLVMADEQHKTHVWVPQIDISPTVDFGPFHNNIINVNRKTIGLVDHNNMVYNGDKNPMNLSKLIMPTVRCPFSLWLYPWDEQQCQFRLSITNVKSDSIKFVTYSFKYTGNKTFDEYYLCSWDMDVSNNTGFLSFKLQRQVNKHIWSTYVPTSLLLGISYGTLYIPAESFTDRGTMSLTTLLVLVSLYTESLSSLPTTAYNKLIDLWYLFIIVYVSLIIAVHLATSNPHSTSIQSNRFLTKRSSGADRWIHRINTTTILKAARVVFAFAFIAYVLYYIYLLC